MGQNDLRIMINEYFDGELDKEKEALLFTQLSLDDDAREYFKDLNMIKSATQQTMEDFPQDLEEHIMYSVGSLSEKKTFALFNKNPLSLVAYGVALVLIFITMHFYQESKEYKGKVDSVIIQLEKQNQNMQVLMNNQLPEAIINAQLENPIIVKASL